MHKPKSKRGRPPGRAARIQISVALSPQTVARLDAVAESEGLSRAAYMRRKIMHLLFVEGV
jgi:predicted DNA-binding protein